MKLRRLISTVCITAAAIMTTGCATARYVQHSSEMITLNKKESILVVSSDDNLKLAIENVLLNGEYKVKDLDIFKEYYLDAYTGRYVTDMAAETGTESYNGAEEIVKVVKKGSISGSKEMLDEMKKWNDLKDELVRVEDYGKLELKKRAVLHKLYKENEIGTIIFVENGSKGSNFNYKVRAVNTQNEEIIFTMYYSINAEAIKLNRSYERYSRTQNDPDSYADAQVVNTAFAKQLASKMLGGGKW